MKFDLSHNPVIGQITAKGAQGKTTHTRHTWNGLIPNLQIFAVEDVNKAFHLAKQVKPEDFEALAYDLNRREAPTLIDFGSSAMLRMHQLAEEAGEDVFSAIDVFVVPTMPSPLLQGEAIDAVRDFLYEMGVPASKIVFLPNALPKRSEPKSAFGLIYAFAEAEGIRVTTPIPFTDAIPILEAKGLLDYDLPTIANLTTQQIIANIEPIVGRDHANLINQAAGRARKLVPILEKVISEVIEVANANLVAA